MEIILLFAGMVGGTLLLFLVLGAIGNLFDYLFKRNDDEPPY